MKTIFSVVFFAFFSLAMAGCVWTRGESRQLREEQKLKMACTGPTEQLVHLLPPEAQTTVSPAVTLVSRCSGFLCTEKTRCTATKSTVREVKVNYTAGGNTTCKIIPVEEHIECGCKCIKGKEQCKGHSEFDEEKCECRCSESARKRCEEMGTEYELSVRTCNCVSRADGSEAF